MLASKKEIINNVSDRLNTSKVDTLIVIDTYLDVIVEELKKGNTVHLANIGVFGTKIRRARNGRNPRTGQKIKVNAKNVPVFRFSNVLKEAVQ